MTEIFKYLKKIPQTGWMKGAVYGIIIAVTYQTALSYMVLKDWVREDYSHCYLIPFVVPYLVWEKRDVLASLPALPSWSAMILFVPGLCLFWLGELGGEFFTMYISLWLLLVGLLWLHLGWQKIRVMAFALFMMLTMFPFPNFINSSILLKLKLISSQLGVMMLQAYGMSAYREGNVIDLGFTQLQVVDACSGLRYVMPLAVLSLLMAYWFRASMWKKIVLCLSSLPLAIMVNSLRIALTGILYTSWGPSVSEGFFHGFSGWLIFVVTIPVLLAEMWILGKIGKAPERAALESAIGIKEEEPKAGILDSRFRGNDIKGRGNHVKGRGNGGGGGDSAVQGSDGGRDGAAKSTNDWRAFLQPVFIVALLLLVTTFAFSHSIQFKEKKPIAQPLANFPLQLGEWTGNRQLMEQEYINVLTFSDYVIVNYKNASGRAVEFYTAYYDSQRKGESIHSPETCLPAGGWTFEQSGETVLPLSEANGRKITVNRAFILKSGERQLVYFWFPQRGRNLTKIYQLKLFAFWDALTKQRTDGALVRLITPVYPNEKLEDAEARLQGFTRQIVPVLDGFIPK
jgi:EpsI family protein